MPQALLATLETPQGVFAMDPNPAAKTTAIMGPLWAREDVDALAQSRSYAATFEAALSIEEALELAQAEPACVPGRCAHDDGPPQGAPGRGVVAWASRTLALVQVTSEIPCSHGPSPGWYRLVRTQLEPLGVLCESLCRESRGALWVPRSHAFPRKRPLHAHPDNQNRQKNHRG
jgi:hypothetical protein